MIIFLKISGIADLPWHTKALYENFSKAPFLGLQERIEAFEARGLTIQDTCHLVKIIIKKNKPTFYPYKGIDPSWHVYKEYKRAIRTICKDYLISDCVVFLNLDDCITHKEAVHTLRIPVLVSTKIRGYDEQIPIPDWEALRGYKDIAKGEDPIELIDKLYQDHPIEKRVPMAFWRGVNSGPYGQEPLWPSSKRGSVVSLSQNSLLHLVDAKFSRFDSPDNELKIEMDRSSYVSKAVPLEEQFKYRYLIDIDGHGCSYSRLFWILGSGSLCLKQTSDLSQWYYPGLSPNRHYIPFDQEANDLEDKILYFMHHPKEAHSIAENARLFFHTYLNSYFQYSHLMRVLKLYGELYNGRYYVLQDLVR